MTPTPARFSVQLGTPIAGWLPVLLVLGDRRFELVASNVLNDALDELVAAAVPLAAPKAVDRTVRIWQEPETVSIRFVSDRDSTRVTIQIFDDEMPSRARTIPSPTHLAHIRYEGDFERTQVATALIIALRVFETCHSRAGRVEGWGSFPSEPIRRVAPACDEQGRTFIAPWQTARGLDRFEAELRTEVSPRHPLFEAAFTIIARRADTDDVLIELDEGPNRFAVVHLTWSGIREEDPRFPSTAFFSSWSDWALRCMLPDCLPHPE